MFLRTRSHLSFILFFVCLICTTEGNGTVDTVAQANNDFGCRFFRTLAGSRPGVNLAFSPLSMGTAFAVLDNGAQAGTRKAIDRAFGWKGIPQDSFNTEYQGYIQELIKKEKDVELTVANSLWKPRGTAFLQDYQDRCRKFYDAETEEFDPSRPVKTADAINGWADRKTRGLIPRIVQPSDVVQASFVIMNAVYFKGVWTSPFEKKETQPMAFVPDLGSARDVPMMHREGKVLYQKGKGFEAVRLSYGEGRFSMVCVLPGKGKGLSGFLKGLNAENWVRWMQGFGEKTVDLRLPRFKVDLTQSWRGLMEKKLGLAELFSSRADLSGMTGTRGDRVSTVLQRCVVDVDEEGTKAAAVTAIIGVTSIRIEPEKVTLTFDRPFFFAIVDKDGTFVFMGTYRKPG